MPHKHTRRGKASDESNFNLDPTTRAKALPNYTPKADPKQQKGKPAQQQKSKLKRKRETPDTTKSKGYKHDDTPRAFSRLMQAQTPGSVRRSGLDDGNSSRSASKKGNKKRTTEEPTAAPAQAVKEQPKAEMPTILPGERLADFSARVNQALPVSGLSRKGKLAVEGVKERRTKTEKKMHKMYDEWRKEEARRKEKEEERRELEEEEEDEKEAARGGHGAGEGVGEGRRGKRKRMLTETKGGDDDDPWAVLKEKREKPKGLHDVVQAPPTLKKPKVKFKVKDGAAVNVVDVPMASGSLKKREELGEARKEVIERYRKMMGRGG